MSINKELQKARQQRYRDNREKRITELEIRVYDMTKYFQDVMYAQISLVKQLTHYKQLHSAACKRIEELETKYEHKKNLVSQ